LLFVASSVPGDAYPRVDIPSSDKLVHLALYGVLGLLCARALITGASEQPLPWRVLVAVGISTAFGLTDELHQSFVPNRSADWHDLVADSVGALLGAAVFAWAHHRRRARR
jgi:VanZ family protein